MRFLILGSLKVESQSSDVGGLTAPQVRKLLGLLIVHQGEVLPTEQIGELLWPGRTVQQQSSALRFHMWKLRNDLEPARPLRSQGSLIAQTGSGYVLRLDGHSLDAAQFEAALRSARGTARREPDTAIQAVTMALTLWRGNPLSDVQYEDFAQAEIRRLVALRHDLDVLRMDLFLRTGRHEEAAADLESLTVTHPLSETMWNQLTTALLRCGRVGDALRTCERAKVAFAEELGIRPPEDLLRMERRIRAGTDRAG